MSLAVHHSVETTPGDRGRALGFAQAGPIANTVAVYLRLFDEDMGLGRDEVVRRGEEVGDRIAAARPALVDELEGMAAGSGHPVGLLMAINARTELLAGGALARGGMLECSVAATTGGPGNCMLAQTWDFHPDLAPSRLLWTLPRGDRGWLATFTEAGILAKTGLNDAGVAVTLNFLASDADGWERGLPVHVLLRMLLGEGEDRDSVERLVHGTSTSASACVTVACAPRNAQASVVSYELSPAGHRAVGADERGLLAHTNHFVANDAVRDVLLDGPGADSSLSRLEQVRSGIAGLNGERKVVARLRDVLSSQEGEQPVFRTGPTDGPWVDRSVTLATLVYDVSARRMWLRTGDDPAADLDEVALPVPPRLR